MIDYTVAEKEIAELNEELRFKRMTQAFTINFPPPTRNLVEMVMDITELLNTFIKVIEDEDSRLSLSEIHESYGKILDLKKHVEYMIIKKLQPGSL